MVPSDFSSKDRYRPRYPWLISWGISGRTRLLNEFDILQLFGALSINNVGGSGLRTDLHFGRTTMDFGMRRYVARNDFRNTTNSFDGVHWQIGEGQHLAGQGLFGGTGAFGMMCNWTMADQ